MELNSTARIVLTVVATLLSAKAQARSEGPNAPTLWNDAALHAVRDSRLPAPEAARAIAIVNTCMYDAWAAFDDAALGTQLKDLLRRPRKEATIEAKQEAISYAAFRALVDVLPVDEKSVYVPLMKSLGYDAKDRTTDLSLPRGIGNVACEAVLEYRHRDKSNQLGDLAPGPYSDWTGYTPRNKPSPIPAQNPPSDPDHWQPLTFVNGTGDRVTQTFAGAQWSQVVPFALKTADQFQDSLRNIGPARFGTAEFKIQVDELIAISAGLSDREKMVSEYWTDGINTEQPAGHWIRIAEWVSERDRHTLDDDVKLYFALSNALMDAGIAAWNAKVTFDSVRPITAVAALYRNQTIRAWGGPGKGTLSIDGAHWLPYQKAESPTPPFPEFVSGHSAYSAAAAEILRLWTKSDTYGASITLKSGESSIEPGITPRSDVTLRWATFTEAAEEAGMSRRYGGIHFKAADIGGRQLGRYVAKEAWDRYSQLLSGAPTEPRLLTAASSK